MYSGYDDPNPAAVGPHTGKTEHPWSWALLLALACYEIAMRTLCQLLSAVSSATSAVCCLQGLAAGVFQPLETPSGAAGNQAD